MKDIVAFYVPYLCGVLDTLVKTQAHEYAVDHRKEIEETVWSIVKDAWAGGQKSQKEFMENGQVLGSGGA